MSICKPDYRNCSVNLLSSIASHCGMETGRPSLPCADTLLQKKEWKNIILMLFDGMGIDMLEKNLPEDAFLRRHIVHTLSSVFPSTTTCATTTIETGLYPCEHAWLGWTLFFPQIDQLVDVYTNKNNLGENAADYYVGERFIPRDFIYPHITACGKYQATSVSNYGHIKIKSLTELMDATLQLARDEEKRYIYTYWPYPDSSMHKYGCYHPKTARQIQDINDRVEALAKALPEDTLLLLTADHGLTDSTMLCLDDYPDLQSMLIRDASLELRTLSFHVKPEYRDQFPHAFLRHFSDHFILMNGETFIHEYLGQGDILPQVYDFVGDYVAIATGDFSIMNHPGPFTMIGDHAGLTEKEMLVPLIAFEK